jgi:4-hydroxyphenylpyruvate dioxygenase
VDRRTLRGVQNNSETIGSIGFHHIEFYCGDAKSMASQFAVALGMSITGTTGQATGNDKCISYGLESGNFRLLLTAPYSLAVVAESQAAAAAAAKEEKQDIVEYDAPMALPNFNVVDAHNFFQKHGLAARAVAIQVVDAKKAFDASVANGATPVLEPTLLPTCLGQTRIGVEAISSGCHIAEVELYGDVVLRFVSFSASPELDKNKINKPFLPHLAPLEGPMAERESYGIFRIDHAVGNVPNLQEAYRRIKTITGFHEFAEFTTEDVGTVESGLNSVVLASDSEEILLPVNEPTEGR